MGFRKENPTDEDLIVLYRQNGDLKVLARLYDPYMPMVYGVCLKYLRDREESKDAVMQIFEKLVTILKSHEVANFCSWLYVSARNHCLMQLRSAKGRRFEEISEVHMETTEILHLEVESEEEINLSRMERCLEELVREQQECLRLFYLQQKCYKDIAAMTGFEYNKVKSYIQNGKRNLKICMERNG